jgi:hypothetical protein
MTDFVYIVDVDFDTPLWSQRCRMTFTDRDEAEKFRNDGERLGYKVIHLMAYQVYTAEKGWRRIKEEKEFHTKVAAQRMDDEIKSMI